MGNGKLEVLVEKRIGIVSMYNGLSFPCIYFRRQGYPNVRIVKTTLIASGQIVRYDKVKEIERRKKNARKMCSNFYIYI